MRFEVLALVWVLTSTATAQAVGVPTYAPPMMLGVDYRIVAVKMPRAATPAQEQVENFPNAGSRSFHIGRNCDLVLIHPNGTETVLVDASHVFGAGSGGLGAHPNASCTDPCVSFDGGTVYFSWFEDPQDYNTQRDMPKKPAYIMKVEVLTGAVTQLTSKATIDFVDTANAVDPGYANIDYAPTLCPDDTILFLSIREGVMDALGKWPAPKFFRMNLDGSNVRAVENFTHGGCQHPVVLKDGRIVWTHAHFAGRRTWLTGNYPLMVANPDMGNWSTFAGVHFHNTAWHFTTQLSTGDVATTVYYHANNFGFGTILRMPLLPAGQQSFGPVASSASSTTWNLTYNKYGWIHHAQPQYTDGNDHFPRLDEKVVTPWTLDGSLAKDDSSPFLPGTTIHAGKVTMPAGVPDGHMLCIWSPGPVNHRNQWEPPHMKIAFIPNGMAPTFAAMTIVKDDPNAHYMYPKPIVRYSRMFGVPRPAIVPDVANDGSSLTELPAGTPFATIGTSSVYNRESAWPPSYQDAWDVNIVNKYNLYTAIFNVGQDHLPYPNSRIFAAQVVVDMGHVDSRYSTLNQRFKTHNNGSQVWGILGEVPLRKRDSNGQLVLDQQGNPDTSYEARIPADVPVHNRLIDVDGITLTQEATWHAPRPGERRHSCGGCHAHSNNTVPLDFNTTWAAVHPPRDFTLKTPLVSQNATGGAIVVDHAQRYKVVEFFRDVRPILDAKCITCHDSSGAPAGGLDLQVDDAGGVITDDVWDRLAYTAPVPPPAGHPQYKHHQATRWVRKTAAGQSLFVWKAYGKRLDGRLDTDRSDDVDFGAAHATTLTFDEMRVLAMWVDLGCLVDVDPSGVQVWDCFDDQMRPTLSVQGIDWANDTAPLGVLNLGVFDVHSGIKPNSLVVTATNLTGGGTAPLVVPGVGSDGGIVPVSLAPLTAGATWRVDISVEDAFVGTSGHGNIARASYTITL